ncbi:ATP-binding protein [Fibrobacterota bacterium]
MKKENKEKISYQVQLPNDLDYIPPLRQFISDIARSEGFPKKFCFRSEIVIDELCTNAIVHGSKDINDVVIFQAEFGMDALTISIKNRSNTKADFENLKRAIERPHRNLEQKGGRGIDIARVLCNSMKVKQDKEGFTQVIVEKRSELGEFSSREDELLFGGAS